jgi:predicted transcriptional regulator
MGRPKAEIDVKEVERLAGLGLTQEEIALSLGIGESTLRKYKAQDSVYSEAIKRGKANACSEVSNQLFQQCKKGNIAAIIWYEKTRRGMSDKVSVSVTELDNQIERELARIAGGSEAGDAETPQAEAVH